MERIGIVTEEAADLPEDIVEKNKIGIVPVILNWPELENMPGDNTFQKMRELEKRGIKSFGKTAQPSPNDFLNKCKESLKHFNEIICITLSSKLSGSNNSAKLANKMLEQSESGRVHVIDSLNASCGQALLILKVLDMIKSGEKTEEILKEIKNYIPTIRLFVMFENPKWLEASGRISHALGTLMKGMFRIKVRPVINMKNGELVTAGLKTRVRDLAEALSAQLHKDIEKLRKAGERIRVAIVHGDDLDGARRLREKVEKNIQNVEVAFVNIIDNVVGAPTGPGTLGIAWCKA